MSKKIFKQKKENSKPKKGITKKIGKGFLAVSTGGVSLLADKKVRKKIKDKKIIKKVGIGALAVATGGLSLAGTKKGKQAIKNVSKKLAKVNPMKTLKNISKKAGNAADFILLAPFMGAMLIALKQKGVKVPHKGNVKEVSNLFYVNVIKKQHLEHCEDLDNNTSGNVAFNYAKKLFITSPEGKEHLVEEAASGIISAILNYFTGKKKQKEAEKELAETGEISPENELTEEEAQVVDTTDPVTEEETQVIEEVDNAHDDLAQETGGEDSQGNIHIPEEDIQEEAEDLENAEGAKYGIMRFINRY